MASKLRSINRAKNREADKQAEAVLPKTLTTSLKNVVESIFALQELSAQRLPVPVSYKLGKTWRQIQTEVDEYMKKRDELQAQYGKKKKDGEGYDRTPKQEEEFQRDLTELLATQVTLYISPIRLSTIKELAMTSAGMMQLDWLVVEDSEGD